MEMVSKQQVKAAVAALVAHGEAVGLPMDAATFPGTLKERAVSLLNSLYHLLGGPGMSALAKESSTLASEAFPLREPGGCLREDATAEALASLQQSEAQQALEGLFREKAREEFGEEDLATVSDNSRVYLCVEEGWVVAANVEALVRVRANEVGLPDPDLRELPEVTAPGKVEPGSLVWLKEAPRGKPALKGAFGYVLSKGTSVQVALGEDEEARCLKGNVVAVELAE